MNLQQLTTWNRLLALDIDAADAVLPFSARLARDNGWSAQLATRAIEEYRKFCFLAVHAGHPVTPSDEVDQVWHLHLLYSRHYWDVLCRDTLATPMHHGPTAGGAKEDRKYRSWYDDTLASYRRYFGEPPRDLWPAGGERFHEQHDFIRVNRRDVVTLNRKTLKRGALALLTGGGVLAVANAVAQADDAPARGPVIGVVAIIAIIFVALVFAAVRASRTRRARSRRGAAKNRSSCGLYGVGGAAGCGSHSKGAGGNDGHSTADAGGPSDGGGAASGCGSGGGGSGCGGS